MLNPKDLDISLLETSNCEASRIDNFIDNDLSDTDSDSDDFLNEYNKWMAGGREKKCNDPIQYWWSQHHIYPQLSRFALDIFSIPAMSAEPE